MKNFQIGYDIGFGRTVHVEVFKSINVLGRSEKSPLKISVLTVSWSFFVTLVYIYMYIASPTISLLPDNPTFANPFLNATFSLAH